MPKFKGKLVFQMVLNLLCLFTLVADGIRLIQENGFKPNTHYYHLGNGGHAYHVNTRTPDTVYFKCAIYERNLCPGRAILRRNGWFSESQAHSHPPDPDFVGERQFREEVLKRIVEQRFVSFQDIIDQSRRDKRYSRRVRQRMNLRRLSSSMSRKRGKRYPKIPDTLLDLTRSLLENANVAITVDEEENLYAGSVTASDGSHHLAFFSPRMLRFVGNLKLIQGDGTFKSRPAVPASRQVFVIVTTWSNVVVPIGWFLMEKKSLAGYRAVFRLLKNICPNLNPDVIVSDWEYVQQQAWHEAFPNAEIHGCLWHLARAFVRKAKKLGLFRYRVALPSLLEYVNRASNIALLPPDLFDEALEILRQEALDEDVLLWHLLTPFFDYVQNDWINNPTRKYWMSCYNAEHRCNNSCEAHNRMLRKKVGAYRPNVFLFIEALACLENDAYLDSTHMGGGGRSRKARDSRSVIHDENIKSLTKDLEMDIFHNRRETISNFLMRAAELNYNVFQDFIRERAAAAN